jgi:hypothetical protein
MSSFRDVRPGVQMLWFLPPSQIVMTKGGLVVFPDVGGHPSGP